MNYKARMLEELIDLTHKIEKLRSFNKTLSEKEMKLLEEQLKAMETYHQTLKERLLLILNDSEVTLTSVSSIVDGFKISHE